MVVAELKIELEAQGLPTDGTRQVLYQRVQKARRINRSRGIPLWVPPVEDDEVVCNVTILPIIVFRLLLYHVTGNNVISKLWYFLYTVL